MLCHLPRPYPDELLYSVLARYVARSGIPPSVLAEEAFGKRRKSVVDLPGALAELSNATRPIWGMSGRAIADRLTMLPFYTRYLPADRTKRCATAMLTGNRLHLPARLGIASSPLKPPAHLRFCLLCREADMATLGETYWRRTHQISGVPICPVHGVGLLDSNASRLRRVCFDYVDATIATEGIDGGIPEKADAIAWAVSRRCSEMFAGEIPRWRFDQLPNQYAAALRAKGFRLGATRVATPRLNEAFAAFYAGTAAADLVKDNFGEWLERLSQQHRKSTHPVRHALLQVFIERAPRGQTLAPWHHGGPWRCPNPYAGHAPEDRPITSVSVRNTSNGAVASAECTCGFAFSFRRTCDHDPTMPIVDRRNHLGPAWATEAARLAAEGFGTGRIAKSMSIQHRLVKRLIGERRSDSTRRSPIGQNQTGPSGPAQ